MRRRSWRVLCLGGGGLAAALVWLLGGRAYHGAAMRFHASYAAAIPAAGPTANNQDKDWFGYTRQWHSAHADHHEGRLAGLGGAAPAGGGGVGGPGAGR